MTNSVSFTITSNPSISPSYSLANSDMSNRSLPIKVNRPLVHQSIRLASFFAFLPSRGSYEPTVYTLLATSGFLAMRNLLKFAFLSSSRPDRRAEPTHRMECAFCGVHIPLEHLHRQATRSSITHTGSLLTEVLGPEHMEGCKGRINSVQLAGYDLQEPIIEGIPPISSSIDSHSGIYEHLSNQFRL